MTASALVRLFFGEGDFDFRLPIGALQELEDVRAPRLAAFGFGPGEASCERILGRLHSGCALIAEVREVLRLGLVHGGMEKMAAHDLVARHLSEGSLLECARIAHAVLGAALVGAPDDVPDFPPGEPTGEGETTAPASPTDASAGPTTSAKARRPASRRAKSAK